MVYRRGVTLLEMMIVLGLVTILVAVTAAYNKGIQRQVVITREHGIVLGMFVKARSAGLAIPKGDPGELICGFGIHVDAASKTFTYFKDLGTAPADCTTADLKYDGPSELISQRVLADDVTVTSDMSDIVYVPPFGKVYIDSLDARTPATIVITSASAGISKGINANVFGQITEFQPAP